MGKPPHAPHVEHWLLVTELCDDNLFSLLHNGKQISWPARVKFASDIAHGMRYLHERQQLVHLDLKSPNVLLKGRECKITDFGSLRRLKQEQEPTPILTAATENVGKSQSCMEPTPTLEQGEALKRVAGAQDVDTGTAQLVTMGVPTGAASKAATSLHGASPSNSYGCVYR